MKSIFALCSALLLAAHLPSHAGELLVYPPVPGLAASEHYKARLRAAAQACGSIASLVSPATAPASCPATPLSSKARSPAVTSSTSTTSASATPVWTSGKDTRKPKVEDTEFFKDIKVRTVSADQIK